MRGNHYARFLYPSKFNYDHDDFDDWADDAIRSGNLLRELLQGRRVLEPLNQGEGDAR